MDLKTLIRKLSSRKFWAMLAAVAVSVMAFFNCPEEIDVKVTSLITSFGAAVVYIVGEAGVDRARAEKERKDEPEE
ncbi:MAG: hypothetical protein J1E96_02535 [Ruminococcus sp.]|nr:hypothetical protein [Ruminococcus sp.]